MDVKSDNMEQHSYAYNGTLRSDNKLFVGATVKAGDIGIVQLTKVEKPRAVNAAQAEVTEEGAAEAPAQATTLTVDGVTNGQVLFNFNSS